MDEGYQLSESYQYARSHWGKRIGAYLFDMLLISMLFFLIFNTNPNFTLRLGVLTLIPVITAENWGIFGIFWLFGIITIIYFTFLEAGFNATIGKWLFNQRVYALDGQLTLGTSFVRNVSKFWWAVVLADWALGVWFYTESKQRIMDTIGNSIVVDVIPLPPPEQEYIPPPVYTPPPVYRPPPVPRAKVEKYTLEEMPEEWLQQGSCPRCSTPFKIVKEEHRFKLIGPWCNRCTWCDRLLVEERELDSY